MNTTPREAQARIKINELLKKAGWRLLDSHKLKANVSLEHRITKAKFKTSDEFGDDFEKMPNGFVDYLLLNDKNQPIALVEAKRENINPLDAKEQARDYARFMGIRYIFLSNGNVHYFWDLDAGNPSPISVFLSIKQLNEARKWQPDPAKMKQQEIDENYIAVAQDAKWLEYSADQKGEVQKNKEISILRDYQIEAANKLKIQYLNGKRRFLFEMATGTGKTLLSAAIIKLFYRSGNANRILFLVDRIELEIQAYKAFTKYLGASGIIVSLLKKRSEISNAHTDWQNSHILVTTIQSLVSSNRYQTMFSPNDFQLIISDEAHRTIGGNNRVIFEYFIGAKLGLTATPKDYLKGVDFETLQREDPRQAERRMLMDTYKIFGCEDGTPTFRFSLEDAVKHKPPYLCLPKLVDIRTQITTEMLSEEGYQVRWTNDNGEDEEDSFVKNDFMRKFFSPETNLSFVQSFLLNAQRDPITDEIGKTIFFCVSRIHCRIITQLLNEEATRLFPDSYGSGSDFAIQITSDLLGSQGNTLKFANNKLNGSSKYANLIDYQSSRSRVCVTVGMMTTGYDCPDILNVVLARPIFSPTDYIQIKGRGTRLHTFEYSNFPPQKKENFYLFDFFANHDFFEDEYDYSQRIKLIEPSEGENRGEGGIRLGEYTHTGADDVSSIHEEQFTAEHLMRVDLEAFSRSFESKVDESIKQNADLREAVETEQLEFLESYIKTNIFNKPSEYWNLNKLQNAYTIDRRVSLTEILRKIVYQEPLKNRSDLVEENFNRFIGAVQFDGSKYHEIRTLFESYLLFDEIRQMFNENNYGKLATDMRISIDDLQKIGKPNIDQTLNYIKDYISINQFLPK